LGRQALKEIHCSAHYASTELIEEVLLHVIRSSSGYARQHEAEFVEKIREMHSLRQGENAKTFTRQIAKNERRIAELDKLFQNLYEDKVGGAISAERFALMSGGYEREQEELKAQNETLQSELDAFKNDSMRAENFLSLVRRYTQVEELNPAMIYEFVDKIIVHEAVWTEQDENNRRKGSRTQKIEVFLKYIGDFNAPDSRSPEEIEAERIAEEKLEQKRARQREASRRYDEKKRTEKAAAKTATMISEPASDIPEPDTEKPSGKPKPAA
jgi:hypothetical protein